MRRTLLRVAVAVFGLILILIAILLLNPVARQLTPVYFYYDLIGQRIAPAPDVIEQFVQQSGQDYCEVGRDSECGGWRLVAARVLPVGPVAQQRGIAAAWCIDYVILRRNQGRTTSSFIYWAYIPRAMIVTQASAGQLDSSNVEDCRTASVE